MRIKVSHSDLFQSLKNELDKHPNLSLLTPSVFNSNIIDPFGITHKQTVFCTENYEVATKFGAYMLDVYSSIGIDILYLNIRTKDGISAYQIKHESKKINEHAYNLENAIHSAARFYTDNYPGAGDALMEKINNINNQMLIIWDKKNNVPVVHIDIDTKFRYGHNTWEVYCSLFNTPGSNFSTFSKLSDSKGMKLYADTRNGNVSFKMYDPENNKHHLLPKFVGSL